MAEYEPIPKEAEHWGRVLLDAAFEVHTILGPGFLERVYEDALCYELTLRRVPFERQKVDHEGHKGPQRQSFVLCSDS
jgi:GxxExxY protein